MNARRKLAFTSLVLWTLALFLPCIEGATNYWGSTGLAGIALSLWASLLFWGLLPLLTNLPVLWAALELRSGPILTDEDRWNVAFLGAMFSLGSLVMFWGFFDWGAFAWLASVALAVASLLVGEREPRRESA